MYAKELINNEGVQMQVNGAMNTKEGSNGGSKINGSMSFPIRQVSLVSRSRTFLNIRLGTVSRMEVSFSLFFLLRQIP